MKLHPEISIGWIALYIFVLLSIPGTDDDPQLMPVRVSPENVLSKPRHNQDNKDSVSSYSENAGPKMKTTIELNPVSYGPK